MKKAPIKNKDGKDIKGSRIIPAVTPANLHLLNSFIFICGSKYKHNTEIKTSVEYCLKIDEKEIKGWHIANKNNAIIAEQDFFRYKQQTL